MITSFKTIPNEQVRDYLNDENLFEVINSETLYFNENPTIIPLNIWILKSGVWNEIKEAYMVKSGSWQSISEFSVLKSGSWV